MGKVFPTYLNDRVYTCSTCHTHLSDHDSLISKAFHGRLGRAYLFSKVVNVSTGQVEDRLLITGLHTVADVFCDVCQTTVGWKYIYAYEDSQRYKIGKFVLERERIVKENDWEESEEEEEA
ncbi:uncharacterized protein VTP21DRAFT_3752 [Calcarisporiella thermophila]|uniref:uncharacterized protein n=1 Tax=Calcarisporiella thermophila TaxID=911321 RepID=UPI00374483D7